MDEGKVYWVGSSSVGLNETEGDGDDGEQKKKYNFRDFADDTTMHGIKYVVLPGARITIKRVLWTLVFALFWVYFISVSVKKVQYFYLYQHITQLDEESQALDFPAITICNLNPIRLSAFQTVDLYYAGAMYGILDEEENTLKEDLFSDSNPTTAALRAKVAAFSDPTLKIDDQQFNLEEFQMRAGHKMEDMLKSCKWRDIKCNASDFKPILTEMGLCYQYNSEPTYDPESDTYAFKRVFKGGAGNGLKMLLITQEDDYLPPKIEDFDSSLETGFKIEVHDPDVPPLVHQLGIGLAPGLQTFVVLQKEEVNYLGSPWGQCIPQDKDGAVLNYTLYSDPACRIECETQHISVECKCRLPFMPAKIEDGEACGPETCTKACHINRYKSSLSSVKFPSYLGAIKLSEEFGTDFPSPSRGGDGAGSVDGDDSKNKSDSKQDGRNQQNYWKEQALVVSIYFQSLSLQKIEQVEAYDFPAMLGDIGGLMGLFIGASAMTLFEFLFFFCDSLVLRRKGGKRSCGGGSEGANGGPGGDGEMGPGPGEGGEVKPLSLPPGAVDGSKFVINVNHNEFPAHMQRAPIAVPPPQSTTLPQFSAHPLHNSFQRYSPLMKQRTFPNHTMGDNAPPQAMSPVNDLSAPGQTSYGGSPVPPPPPAQEGAG